MPDKIIHCISRMMYWCCCLILYKVVYIAFLIINSIDHVEQYFYCLFKRPIKYHLQQYWKQKNSSLLLEKIKFLSQMWYKLDIDKLLVVFLWIFKVYPLRFVNQSKNYIRNWFLICLYTIWIKTSCSKIKLNVD